MRILSSDVILFAASVCCASAYPQFQEKIPNGAAVVVDGSAWPGVGHERSAGGGRQNAFGDAFSKAGRMWTKELCAADSDGDGRSNGVELGDPDCTWVLGAKAPGPVTGHPGIKEDTAVKTPSSVTNRCALPANSEADKDLEVLAMTDYALPAAVTTYVCKRFKVTLNEARHMVRLRAKLDQVAIAPVITHHMLLFACAPGPPLPGNAASPARKPGDIWECAGGMPAGCTMLQYAWAFGGKEFCLPEEAGLRLEKGDTDLVIQFHYDNPEMAAGKIDNSGLEIVHTKQLRTHDAGWLHTGVTPFSIPPKQPQHCMQAECIPGSPRWLPMQTQQAWTGPVTAFAHMEHMHELGKEMHMEQFRDGKKIADLIDNRFFDFNAQEIVDMEPVEVRHTDMLRTSCVTDSTTRTGYTFSGEGTSDEMCFGYLVYYPSNGSSLLCVSMIENECQVDTSIAGGVRKIEPTNVGPDQCLVKELAAECKLPLPLPNPKMIHMTLGNTDACSSTCCHALIAQLEGPAFATCTAAEAAALDPLKGNFLSIICPRRYGKEIHETRSMIISAGLCDKPEILGKLDGWFGGGGGSEVSSSSTIRAGVAVTSYAGCLAVLVLMSPTLP